VSTMLAFLFISLVVALPTFPNIGWLGLGYDLMYGNPHAWGIVDPGFRGVVFNMSLYQGATTPDGRYQIPFGTAVQQEEACSLSFTGGATTFTGSYSYQNSLKVTASVQGGFGPFGSAAFSANADYQTVDSATSTTTSVFTSASAQCSVYKASLSMPFQPPPLDDNFLLTIANASLNFNPQDPNDFYYNFIGYFGTHVSYVIHMGGSFGRVSQFSGSQWSSLQNTLISSGFSVSVASAFDAMIASGSTLSQSQEQIAQAFSSQTIQQSEFSVGARPPSNGSVNEWISQALINPMPLWYTLIPLHELLTPQFFPQDQNIGIKQKNLFNAMNNYCPMLLGQGAVKTCSAPTPNNYTYTTVLQFTPVSPDGWLSQLGTYTLPGLITAWSGLSSAQPQTLTIIGDHLPVTSGAWSIYYFLLYGDTYTFDTFYLNLDTIDDSDLIVNIAGVNSGGNSISCSTGVQVQMNSAPALIYCAGGNWADGYSLTILVSVSET